MTDQLVKVIHYAAVVIDHHRDDSPLTLQELTTSVLTSKKVIPLEPWIEPVANVCEGCLEYRKILKGIIKPFLAHSQASILRRDVCLYKVLGYILFFQFDLYTSETLAHVLEKLYTFPVRKFLLYFAGDEKESANVFYNEIKENWYAAYDREYVDATFLCLYRKNEKTVRSVIEKVEAIHQSSEHVHPINRKKLFTVAKPFRFIAEPPIPSSFRQKKAASHQAKKEELIKYADTFRAKSVPASTYRPSEDTRSLLRRARRRKRKNEKFRNQIEQRELLRAREKQAKSEPALKKRLGPGSHTLAKALQSNIAVVPDNPVSKPRTRVRKFIQKPPEKPVKPTAAAVLREKALFDKQRRHAEKRFQAMAEGAGDPEEYEARIRKLEEKDLEAAIVENERKILDAMQSLEKAIVAKKAYLEEAKRKGLDEKELKLFFREQRQAELDAEISELRATVESAQRISKAHLKEARRRAADEKLKKAQVVKTEKNVLKRLFEEQQREEMEKRKQVISQIREMEARIVAYEKTFDFGETPKFGFLTDMSLADLKDRLIALHFEVLEKMQEKRLKIFGGKETAKRLLEEAVEFVQRERPYWQRQNRIESERLQKVKEQREMVRQNPEFQKARELLIRNSQDRRKRRVEERQEHLKLRDSTWAKYVYM